MKPFQMKFQEYRNKGYSVIPVKPETKGPYISGWSNWCDNLPSLEEMKKWSNIYRDANIGICCGKQSKVIGIDLDLDLNDPNDKAIYEAIKLYVPDSPVEKVGKKGFTRFFKFTGEQSSSIKLGSRSIIDVLADKRQSVLPPSIHAETNEPYKWMGKSLLDIDPNLLPVFPKENLAVIKKIISELEKDTSAQKIQGRNNALKDQVVAAIHSNKTDEEIKNEILEYDLKHHNPPLFSDPNESQMKNSSPQENALKFVQSIRESVQVPSPTIKKRYQILTMEDLYNAPDEEYEFVVDNLLPQDGSSVIAGKPKDGKSTLVRQLAVCIAQGKQFLGRNVIQGPVLYLGLEENQTQVKKHFQLMGVKQSDPILSIFMNNDLDVKGLSTIIEEYKPVLTIIDPLFLFLKVKDSNSYSEVYPSLHSITALARKMKTHILTVHHMSKGEGDGADKILGSTAIFGAVDTAILFKRRSEGQVISSRQKYGDSLEPTNLIFDIITKSFSVGNTVEESEHERIAKEVIQYVIKSGKVKRQQIVENVTGKSQIVSQILEQYEKHGLERSGNGGKGDAYHYQIKNAQLTPTTLKSTATHDPSFR